MLNKKTKTDTNPYINTNLNSIPNKKKTKTGTKNNPKPIARHIILIATFSEHTPVTATGLYDVRHGNRSTTLI